MIARCQDLPLPRLVEDLRAHQARRWRAGERVPAEAFLKASPQLGESAEDALVLIWGEVLLRLERGEVPQVAEYQARFPHHADALAIQFDLQGHLDRTTDAPTQLPSPATAPAGASLPEMPGYEILGELGRGGMGVVYKARQTRLNRVVALKMILAGELASAAEVQRFRTEAEAAAHLDHPHIVPIYEVGEHHGQPYFSMKLVEGTCLSEHLPRLTREPRAAVRLVAAVARAIHHAHQRGIIHRDLKPANIMVDGQGEPLVTDFGLAKRVVSPGGEPRESGLTQTGSILGTPSYMAPEQARQPKALTTAVDIYSVGAILYELLTGRPPFQAETPLETVLQVLEKDPAPPRSLKPEIDRDLELICLKCLAKDPQQRYGSAEGLADDLDHWLAGEPLSVRPPAFASLLRIWLRQNFGAAGWTVVLGLIWGLFTGIATWLSRADFILFDHREAYARLPNLTPSVLGTIGRMPSWLQIAAFLLLLPLTSIIGLLVVLLVRPKNRAAAVTAGAATGLLWGLASFAFGVGWLFLVGTTLYPAGQADSDLRLLSETAHIEAGPTPQRSGADAKGTRDPAEQLFKKYPDLRGVPSRERGPLVYHKIMADLTEGIPLGIWLGLLCTLGSCVVVSLVETAAAGILLRRLGRVRAVIRPYIELVFPGVVMALALLGGTRRLLVGWFAGHTGQLLVLVVALLLLGLAMTAVLRGWHWLVRCLLHGGWLSRVESLPSPKKPVFLSFPGPGSL
jgi:hypothetical protein